MPNPLVFEDFRNQKKVAPELHSKWDVSDAVERRPQTPNDVLVVGHFAGGVPDFVYKDWLTYSEIEEAHDPDGTDNPAVKLIRLMKTPCPDLNVPGAGRMSTVRAGNAVQATQNLQDSVPENVLALTSEDYGIHTNFNKSKVENGSDGVGKKVTLGWKEDDTQSIVGDNLARVLSIQYTGDASTAVLTVTNASGDEATAIACVLAGDQTDGSAGFVLSLSAPDFDTLSELATYINSRTGYTCSLYADTDVDAAVMPSSTLDAFTGSIKAQQHLSAGLYAIEYWVNQVSPRVSAAKVSGKTNLPANKDWSYFTGGSAPAPAASDYEDALDAAAAANLRGGFLFLDSTDAAVVAVAVTFQSEQLNEGKIW